MLKVQRIAISQPRFDAAAAPEIRAALEQELEPHTTRLMLDLSKVDFVDSTGLGVLVSIIKKLGAQGRIAIVGARPAVRRLFEITQLNQIFQLCAGETEARLVLDG